MQQRIVLAALVVLAVLAMTIGASAQQVAASAAPAVLSAKDVSAGDTAWVSISTGLVLLMTIPGLAFFYGGLVRRKNVLSILMQCFMMMCLITLQWVLFGYSLAFGPDVKGLIGNLAWAGLQNVSADTPSAYAPTIPHQMFMIFQMMFAVITPALIVGAFAERMKFAAFAIFSLLWATFVYDPICHWVWGKGGFLNTMGVLDFAGGTVVHINAGIASLVAALVIGKRLGYPNRMSPPHNLPFATLGAGLLWFGWFGFNAGSALSAGGLSTRAFVATHLAAAAGGLTWAVMDMVANKRATVLGIISGGVAGLATITQAAGYVTPMAAIAIGIIAGIVPWIFVSIIKPKFGYDDALDAFGVHGIGGILGALLTGVFACKAVNSAGADGLLYGNFHLFKVQCIAVVVTITYAFVVSFILLRLVDALVGLRADAQSERIGLDLTDHRETGYTVLD
ncbi:MAG: ammonium transporter [Verrucomicrobia bacterium]|nr:MAG: ammonium transporter [Verrucomicrobiota bacterium]